jgi:hypothetical protein
MVFGEPVLGDGDKSFSGTRMKIKCCRGLIKATQNIITLVQQQQWINAAYVIIINFKPRHHKFNAFKSIFSLIRGLNYSLFYRLMAQRTI